eukprot:401747_1
MTGSTIFYSTDYDVLNTYWSYNQDLTSTDYASFLATMTNTLNYMQNSISTDFLTSLSCTAPKPMDLTFYISDLTLEYSTDYKLYKFSASTSSTI